MADYNDEGRSDYQVDVEVWAKERREQLGAALEGVWNWDRVLLRKAGSFTEYQAMRQARLVRAAEWIMANTIQPSS
jgi:hypothetical protein